MKKISRKTVRLSGLGPAERKSLLVNPKIIFRQFYQLRETLGTKMSEIGALKRELEVTKTDLAFAKVGRKKDWQTIDHLIDLLAREREKNPTPGDYAEGM